MNGWNDDGWQFIALAGFFFAVGIVVFLVMR